MISPTLIHSRLAEIEGSAKRSLSQNFLIDGNTARKIVNSAQVSGKKVLEIGPGLGSLTESLLAADADVTAVECDRRFAPILERLPINLIMGDALKIDLSAHLEEGASVVANLPYHISSKLIEKLLLTPYRLTITVMIQKELAQRFANGPCDRYMTALIRCLGECSLLFDVSSSCFFPRPSVTSSILQIKKERTVTQEQAKELRELFMHKRKKIKGMDRRPQELSIEELYWFISRSKSSNLG
ncbi:MAG: 16S rRNA (adenine(1518)-N(6)/adenine(1519)-N(6))-dimethyltransferase RsmA [Simkaniaceae bacterium]|nr:16S rRNA (adenine(1518)-N(6)/adenine(1519)-N(6))-dimethyltransferase RsmA [Simkaniaceae bacterium]